MPADYFFREYLPVGARRARGALELRRLLRAEKRRAAPIVVDGRKIVRTFWGRAWCENLERYSDFASRLPRGRSYARNGSVLDLQIVPGAARAYVAGYELYTVDVSIAPLPARRWRGVVCACGSEIGSVIGLLRGELPDDVLAVLTDGRRGLFPEPREIRMRCSCPDAAVMCKHVAATLYGVGVRLDQRPELFFTLRQVNQEDLVQGAATRDVLGVTTRRKNGAKRIASDELESIFRIEMLPEAEVVKPTRPRGR
ncbi:MAG: hypothetical protein E6J56_02660 [Deltaproteobacteria bacterium]|nr:MAG: hypothetical protein E6J77_17370 [Deltaproteobacteria bacterium]TMB58505.1 MAG: hypothetical protein E6J56_02660 [Deltaproteobacteria bacterium]